MDIKEYSRMIDEFAWYGNGDVFRIAKAAKAMGRNYMDDITEAKKQLIESGKAKRMVINGTTAE